MRKTVFLSSTGKDLAAWRAQVIEDLRGHDWFRLDAMEEWGARSRPPMHLCRERVAESHIFVGVIGHYRGWEPDGDNGLRSITEMEYDWAVDGKKPRLMFVAPESFAGAAPASDGDAKARQQAFRARLMSAETVETRCFGSVHALSTAVLKALFNELFYEIAAQGEAAPTSRPGALNAAQMAGAVIAEVAQERNLSLEAMRAKGFGPKEIEAILTEEKHAAKARMTQHQTAAAGARKEAAQAAKKLGALAYLYDTQKALAAYAEAVQLDPDDWEAFWFLGQIQMRAGNLRAAKNAFERLIALHSAVENPYFIHWSYFLLGDVEAGLGNGNEALKDCARGQGFVRALLGKDPNNAEWQRDLSVSYNKIGDISAARGDRDGALKAYMDGLDIAKQLAARDPENAEWQRDLWVSFNKTSEIHAARGDLKTALELRQAAVEVAIKLTKLDPSNAGWQRDLSISYNLIGDISAARGDRDGALKAYKDGLDIAKQLAARDPENAEWQRDLSVSYNRVGDISAARGDRDGALKAYKDGLDIAKQLAARDPNNAGWQRDLSVSYERVGNISAARGDRDGALKAYKDGLDIRKQLAARDPENAEWQRDLSVSYNKIGDISSARGDRDRALKAYKDGLDIAKQLAARDPVNVVWQTDLAVSAGKLAAAGAKDKRQYLASGLAILKRLDAEGKLTADQKKWIALFEHAMQEPESAGPQR